MNPKVTLVAAILYHQSPLGITYQIQRQPLRTFQVEQPVLIYEPMKGTKKVSNGSF